MIICGSLMKILFTANRFPYPPYRGDKLKIFHLARQLSRYHELHLVTFLQDSGDVRYLPELRDIFTEIHLVPLPKARSYWHSLWTAFRKEPFQVGYFRSVRMTEMINGLKRKHRYDAVHVQHLRMAQYWADDQTVPRILDLPDAYSLYWKRRAEAAKGLFKIFNKVEQQRVSDYEQILEQYDLSLVCSTEDMQYLRREKGIANVQLLPNGVDLSTFSGAAHDYSQDSILLFTGNMDYAPNVDAVIYFVQEIFPEVKKRVPGIRFVIAGQRPVKKVRALAAEDIVVTGFVKNLSEVYAGAAILVAPLRFGAGTQNKVLEAMAMGLPVVSHEVGFGGLGIRSGEGVLLAPDKEQFIEECVRLLKAETLRRTTGEAGRSVIVNRYSWEQIAAQLEKYLLQVCKNTGG